MKNRPGISLLFAMIVVTVGFLIMVGSINLATSTMQNTRATGYRLDAYYGALSGLEQAGWNVAKQADDGFTGYQTTGSIDDYTTWGEDPIDIDLDADSDTTDPGESQTYYYIAGQSGTIASDTTTLYNPLPGTGTAGSDCSIFNPPTGTNAEDDPCAWNKLEIGDIASIPLYYSNDDGTAVENPSGHSGDWSSFELYIRTPCGTWNSTSGCSGLDAKSEKTVPVINWEIIANCALGTEACYLIPYSRNTSKDSHIFESDINRTTFALESSGFDPGIDQTANNWPTIIDFIKGSTITEPVLRFSIINSITLTDGTVAPYVEYQLRTSGNQTKTANADITLVAKGFGGPSGTFEQTLTRALGRSTNIIQFVLD